MPLVRSPQLRSASRSALREAIYEIGSTQSSQRCRPGPENPLRSYGQMRRRREIEDARDVANVVTGILGELRGRDEPHQIDHAFEIRRAWPGEISTQVLAAQTDSLCQLLRRDRAAGMSDDHLPRAFLERRTQAQRVRRLPQ